MKLEIYTAKMGSANYHSRKPIEVRDVTPQEAWEILVAYGLVLGTQAKVIAKVCINDHMLRPRDIEFKIDFDELLDEVFPK